MSSYGLLGNALGFKIVVCPIYYEISLSESVFSTLSVRILLWAQNAKGLISNF